MLAEILGALAIASGLVWPVVRGRRLLLGIQAASSLLWASHYAAIGPEAYTGAIMCALVVIQALTASYRPARWAGVVFWLTIPVMLAFVVATWAGPQSAGAAFGLFVSALGRWETNPIRMRLLFILCIAGWASHNLIVGSLFALTSDALTVLTNSIGIYRERCVGGSMRAALRPISQAIQGLSRRPKTNPV
jgi:hypothetical protein